MTGCAQFESFAQSKMICVVTRFWTCGKPANGSVPDVEASEAERAGSSAYVD